MLNNMAKSALTAALLPLCVALGASTAFAAPDEESAAASSHEAPRTLDPIRVTGYHLKRRDIEGPSPVLVIGGEELQRAGVTTLEEFARRLPLNWSEPVLRFDRVGAAGFDLRGIGIDATLTLVNGLRIAPYAQYADNYIDVNAIPVAAIERIEILKDGASAIYGADAIAGVVNIVLRRGYQGLQVSAGYGGSEHGDGRDLLADLVAGHDSGRSSLLFTLSALDREAQPMAARSWSADADWSAIGGPNFRSAYGSPPTLLRYDSFSFAADPACGTDPLVSSIRSSSLPGTVCGFNFAQFQDQFPAFERIGATLSGQHLFAADLMLFADLLYTDSRATAHQAPQGIAGSTQVETYLGFPFVPADHPDNPFDADGELLSRLLSEGARVHRNDASSYRAVVGLEGALGRWEWRVSALDSRSEVSKTFENLVSRSRYQQALLGQGGPGGDQWFNPFGYAPGNDPALTAWLVTDAGHGSRSGERSIDLLFSGDAGGLPAGPLGVALGLQYREQELDQRADEEMQTGDLGHFFEPVSAQRDITALFAELRLPLLDSLEAQLALRYEDYSDFGSTTNPKIAVRWRAQPSLNLRASFGTSFKPPAFYELYQPPLHESGLYVDSVRCGLTGLPEDCQVRAYPLTWGGNPDLGPEEGESRFIGALWTPGFLSGFEFQLDFWDFRHEERIERLDAQRVLDAGGGFGIRRAPPEPDGTPGRILEVTEIPVNYDQLRTRGFDTMVVYAWKTSALGDFRATLAHTYVDEWTFTDSQLEGLVGRNFAGAHRRVAIPRNRANLNLGWEWERHGLATNLHYAGHYENHTGQYVDGSRTGEPMIISSHTTLDVQYRFRFERLRDAVLRVGCNNVADTDPPLNFGGLEPLHDGRGRYWYLRWRQPIR